MVDALKDPRAYLQQRVALFTGVTFVFFTVMLLVDWSVPAEGEATFSSTRIASLSVLTSNGAIWAFTRKGERPAWICRALELASMLIAMAVFATLPVFPPIEGAGGVMAIFSPLPMAIVIMLRAATIPSPWWLSAAVAFLWGVVMTACGMIGWEGVDIVIPGQPYHGAEQFPLAMGVSATVAFSFVAGIISHVVYGLQTRVRKALELGQYTLEAKIGEGGMGAVYRARHRMLRRPTAVKLLPPDKAGEKAIARFEREVQQTSRLTHPNTIAIFDYGRTQDGLFYYAMEYLDGISLQDLVDMTGPVPPERAVHILVQAAGSLSEAHGAGLVHRDIKPDNIVLCERGGVADVVKVLDFGLVKDVEAPKDAQLSAADTIHGTPLYMAPEAITDPETIDGRADLYGLGAIAYFLLTGTPVFHGNAVQVFAHHLKSQPEPLIERVDGVDAELEGIVMRCLEKSPDERFASAAELADALRACRASDAWTPARARDWWDEQRESLAARRDRTEQSADLQVEVLPRSPS